MFMPLLVEHDVAPGVANPMQPQDYRFESVTRETHDTFTLALEPCGSVERHPFAPGQFSMLLVPGVGELPISISGDPEVRRRLVYTVRSVGLATQALVSRRPGDIIGVRGPFGTSWPVDSACGKDLLIVAGGIGLAPLRPAIYHIMRNREEYVRLIVLYGARSPGDLLFRKELAAWARMPDTLVLSTVDYGGVNWKGRVGIVTTLFRHVRLHSDRTIAMICGPEIMMRYVIGELADHRGVPAADVHLSMERNMKCGVGLCGHCQYGPYFVCKDGPVFRYDEVRTLLNRYEL
jgi:NAD(P)H-flavin reductase